MEDKKVSVNFRFPKSLLTKLKKEAEAEYRTLTSIVIERVQVKKNGK